MLYYQTWDTNNCVVTIRGLQYVLDNTNVHCSSAVIYCHLFAVVIIDYFMTYLRAPISNIVSSVS